MSKVDELRADNIYKFGKILSPADMTDRSRVSRYCVNDRVEIVDIAQGLIGESVFTPGSQFIVVDFLVDANQLMVGLGKSEGGEVIMYAHDWMLRRVSQDSLVSMLLPALAGRMLL